ncbi:PucR family transcriptional regulator [Rhizohabitans arisaemae]|uniref:PucR family transcriptional regulator n=1 Tax=Rhizohabitans arisaemae TaxID=2720610 RepID=UPI0024B235BA|nr:helix-turn-helix domain-containing protein [Rhizohabitans arisaemae]
MAGNGDLSTRIGEAVGVPADLLREPVSVVVDAVDTGRPPGRDAIGRCREAAALAAERGAPLKALVEAVLLAAEHLTASGTASAPIAALRRTILTLMDGYEAAQRAAIRKEVEARREFIHDLLHGRAERLAERAEHFGLALAEAYTVTVARPAQSPIGADPVIRRIEHLMIARFGSHNVLVTGEDGLLVCVSPGTLPAAVGEFTHHVRAALEPGWRIGVGRPHHGPGGVVTSYREACGAVELGDRLGLRAPVLKAADLLVFPVLLRDRAAIEDLVGSVLAPLRQARGGPGPLLATLEAVFAAQGNQSAAARRLGISSRAVTYRLERIRRLTGFSPDDPTQRFTLEAAVLGARLLDWPEHPFPHDR